LEDKNINPRQDGNANGWIKEYAIYISNERNNWSEPVAQEIFEKNASVKIIISMKSHQGNISDLLP